MSESIDTKLVSRLAAILKINDLSEIEYETENCRISLIKHRPTPPTPPAAYAPVAPAAPLAQTVLPTTTNTTDNSPSTEIDMEDLSKLPGCVKSPMVGVVYLSSDPNAQNYVKIGDTVSQGDTVCLIEAMKTFNPVKAHTSGKVTKILVESGDPVEYGEPLIIIE